MYHMFAFSFISCLVKGMNFCNLRELSVFCFLQKTTFPDEVRVSGLSAGVYKFKLTVTDNAGQSESAEVTVLVLTPEQSHREYLS